MNSGRPTDTASQVWKRSTEVSHRTLAGVSVLRRLSDDKQIVLRSLASLTWVGLQSPSSVEELVEDLRAVGVVTTDRQISSELSKLEARNLVVNDD